MGSRKLIALSLLVGLGLGASGVAVHADNQDVSYVVTATGKTGSVRKVSRAQRPDQVGLESDVNAGVIPRAALQSELAKGIGRFLQQVRTQPVVARRRFVGWRLLTLFPDRSDIRVAVLKPGDLVLRINGESVERPEDFKAVWDSLASASELVLEIERDGEPSTLHYTIQ
jgi:type II secretory pathway component PulC